MLEQDPNAKLREEREREADSHDGEVSEVQVMDPAEADTPISDSQSVGGQPDMDSGEVNEGAQGPNANPHAGQDTH